jgi:hypothetical protein
MKNKIGFAVIFLDFVLIMMTATWVIVGIQRQLTVIDLTYNVIYVIVSIVTLFLNILLIHRKEK